MKYLDAINLFRKVELDYGRCDVNQIQRRYFSCNLSMYK